MPVYVCYPGLDSSEPWMHHLQVFAAPFDSNDEATVAASTRLPNSAARPTSRVGEVAVGHNDGGTVRPHGNNGIPLEIGRMEAPPLPPSAPNSHSHTMSLSHGRSSTGTNTSRSSTNFTLPPPIRKVRHSEILIVDDVCFQYAHYWLRLRWPGRKGGFAGYIQVPPQVPQSQTQLYSLDSPSVGAASDAAVVADVEADATNADGSLSQSRTTQPTNLSSQSDMMASSDNTTAGVDEFREEDDPAFREETSSMPPSEPFEEDMMQIMCRRTGLAFCTTNQLKLLALYDDGVVPNSALPPFATEPVFCRICREGLHDDADEDQPAAASDEGDVAVVPVAATAPAQPDTLQLPQQRNAEMTRRSTRNQRNNSSDFDREEDDEDYELVLSDPTAVIANKGPVIPHPTYAPNSDAQQNPMLAPCECSGSMAFVHYLCVEQWRCRSRHPEAANGLNCETCGTAYSLPPPTERLLVVPEQEDWLDAMPPHVMQALRQPHIWWQIGASIVRRRWLRPIAPILLSPTVALYCRARRLLKKRGVARRRWACSLCRRRARWKCVRCLRSYYCSRQCQNVSWHIIHKHVCYKPARFWWSVVVYGGLTLLMCPGILRDPLMYDIGVCLVPASFVVMGILGGGLATGIKRMAGFDLRGRLMEMAVVLTTIWLSVVSWGLVQAFFGNASSCYGTLGIRYPVSVESNDGKLGGYILGGLRALLLKPAERVYLAWDQLFWHSWFRSVLCLSTTRMAASNSTQKGLVEPMARTSCFEHLPHANADFFLVDETNGKCASDLLLVTALYVAAGVVFAGSALWKHHERHQRRRRGARRPARDGGGQPGQQQQQAHLHND